MDLKKILFMLLLIILLLAGIFLAYSSYTTHSCYDECRSNPTQIRYANISGHGIEHTCDDECIGGVSSKWL